MAHVSDGRGRRSICTSASTSTTTTATVTGTMHARAAGGGRMSVGPAALPAPARRARSERIADDAGRARARSTARCRTARPHELIDGRRAQRPARPRRRRLPDRAQAAGGGAAPPAAPRSSSTARRPSRRAPRTALLLARLPHLVLDGAVLAAARGRGGRGVRQGRASAPAASIRALESAIAVRADGKLAHSGRAPVPRATSPARRRAVVHYLNGGDREADVRASAPVRARASEAGRRWSRTPRRSPRWR